MDIIKINSFSEITSILEKVKTLNPDSFNIDNLDISSISTVKIKIDGAGYNGEVSSSLCHSLCDFHTNLLKIYCLEKYGTDNLSKLKTEEKEQLNVVFNIEAGCTEWSVDLKDFIQKLADNILLKGIEKMTPLQITSVFLFTIVGVTGYAFYNRYAEIQENKTQLEAVNEIAKTTSAGINQALVTVSNKSKEMYIDNIKSYKNPNSVSLSIDGEQIDLDKTVLDSIVNTPKSPLKSEDGKTQVNISQIKRNSLIGQLTVTCIYDEAYSFPLSVDESFVSTEEINALFDAFKNDRPIIIKGLFKTRDGKIEKAQASVIEVEAETETK